MKVEHKSYCDKVRIGRQVQCSCGAVSEAHRKQLADAAGFPAWCVVAGDVYGCKDQFCRNGQGWSTCEYDDRKG